MPDEKNRLKSSIELAMERLKKKDEESGVTSRPLTDADKAAIAEIRNFYGAKLAQEDVLHESKIRNLVDAEAREVIDQQFRRDRERLTSERDAKIEKVRRGT
jgi:hypothetical protein